MDPVAAAADFVATRFPGALAAFVGGSVLTEARTATSDLDVVVVLDGPPAPFRETFRHAGWVVEAFVQEPDSLDYYYGHDEQRRVCSLLRMCGESVVVTDPAGIATEIQAEARRRIGAGPRPLSEQEREAMRYGLTDLLDDLVGCRAEDELPFIAAAVTTQIAELALAAAGAWGGRAKALHRSLVAHDADLAARLVDAHRQVVAGGPREPLREIAHEVLGAVGGPLLEGYRLDGRTGR